MASEDRSSRGQTQDSIPEVIQELTTPKGAVRLKALGGQQAVHGLALADDTDVADVH